MQNKKIVLVGLTGGVATGKSTVAKMFRRLGVPTIDTDQIAHMVIRKGRPEYRKILKVCGKTILRKDGEINRGRLGEMIFSPHPRWTRLRKRVEKIIHPAIWKKVIENVQAFKCSRRARVIVLEVPLLFEAGWDKKVDYSIVVICSYEQQLERCPEFFRRCIDIQMPLSAKTERADFVIDNSYSRTRTMAQVRKLFYVRNKC